MGIVERVQRAFPELSHCAYYEFEHQGEALCAAVDFFLRGVWVARAGELHGVDPDDDPELAELLTRNGIRL